jgi:hypothetical protein
MYEDTNRQLLRDAAIMPSEEVLRGEAGMLYPLYLQLVDLFEEYSISLHWRYYVDGSAWLGKVTKGSKTVCWLSLWDQFFKVSFYFPIRLTNRLLNLDIPEELRYRILALKPIGKTLPIPIEYSAIQQIDVLKTLIGFKLGK